MGTVSLAEIPGGTLCVADTNILLYAEQGASAQCQKLLRRCADGEVLVTLPQTVWHELAHKLMLAEAVSGGGIRGRNPALQLAANPAVVKRLRIYREKLLALAALGIGFVPSTRADLFDAAFLFQRKYGLLTNDSLILATALRVRADVLATADKAYRDVDEIRVAMPSDIGD